MIIFRAVAIFCVLGLLGTAALSQSSDTGAAALFKRVPAPKPGSRPKIDVQVNPDEYFDYFNPTITDPATPTESAVAFAPPLPHDAFWRRFVELGQPVQMELIGEALSRAPADQPPLQALADIVEQHKAEILLATVGTKVSPALVLSVIMTESSGRADAVSSAGAQGLMQLIPATAERFNVEDAMDPAQNIKGGVTYLDWLMNEFGGNPVHVIAAYNSGENSVKGHNGTPPFPETRGYVPKVLAAWQVARNLCITPPELISDGCVFK